MIISLIGASGVGKDTQAKLLAQKLNLPNISTGQIMRDEAKAGNPVAIAATEAANKGIWPSDEQINELFINYIDNNCRDGFILTGYPRTEAQYHFLKGLQERYNVKLHSIIHLVLPEEIMVKRMLKQAKEAEEKGEPRGDTDEAAMKQRIQSYRNTIQPIVDAAQKDEMIIEISAEPSIEEVHQIILNKLNLS